MGKVMEEIDGSMRHDELPLSRFAPHVPHSRCPCRGAFRGHDGAGGTHGPRNLSRIRAHPDRRAETRATANRRSADEVDQGSTQGPPTAAQKTTPVQTIGTS